MRERFLPVLDDFSVLYLQVLVEEVFLLAHDVLVLIYLNRDQRAKCHRVNCENLEKTLKFEILKKTVNFQILKN